jgi:hypothetical protein
MGSLSKKDINEDEKRMRRIGRIYSSEYVLPYYGVY